MVERFLKWLTHFSPEWSALADDVFIDAERRIGDDASPGERLLARLIALMTIAWHGGFLTMTKVVLESSTAISFRRLFDRRRVFRWPGSPLRSISEFFFSTRTHERVFDGVFADWIRDWQTAIIEQRDLQVRWINLKYTCLYVAHFGKQLPFSIFKALIELWKSAS